MIQDNHINEGGQDTLQVGWHLTIDVRTCLDLLPVLPPGSDDLAGAAGGTVAVWLRPPGAGQTQLGAVGGAGERLHLRRRNPRLGLSAKGDLWHIPRVSSGTAQASQGVDESFLLHLCYLTAQWLFRCA